MHHVLLIIASLLLSVSAGAAGPDPFTKPGAVGTLGDSTASQPHFLPVEQAYPLDIIIVGDQLQLRWDITDGYYLYRERMQLSAFENGIALEFDYKLPNGEAHEDEFFGQTEVYRGLTEFSVPRARSGPFQLEVRSQGCADAGLCYPPRKQWFEVDPLNDRVTESTPPEPVSSTAATTQPPSAPATDRAELASMALLALLGGVILNLMPCVFPVLSLKVLSLANSQDGSSKLLHSVSYTLGVVLSFVAVAALLLSLRGAGAAIGWGFHLQSPSFVAALSLLFFTMGLGLSGFVNLGSGMMGIGGQLAERAGYAGSFFTGVLATVVASPCTAPFMGTALGFAMTQPAVIALTIFAALGVGMALPFLLLSLSPGLLRLLPKPGQWMERFKEFLAFPLYAAAIWLLWVLGNQSGVNAMAIIGCSGILIALALWIWEGAAQAKSPVPRKCVAAVVAVLALSLLRSPLLTPIPDTSQGGHDWERYSDERTEALLAQGKPVFINITADWCITCLANERVALSSQSVKTAFNDRGITYLKGDWTNADPTLTALLTRHGRTGVPLYLWYDGGSRTPVILPQLLTPGTVMAYLDGRQSP